MKKTKQVELLAPAGSFEGFLGAIQAGADAVYLGGDRYGARAYAHNFTTEEIIEAIKFAHLFGRRVYLTVNTLMKEKELQKLPEFLLPLYEAGLDAVIIQDLGAFRLIGEYFPGLDRHISTQMTVTGGYGAALLKELGAVRIVPARELQLEEIRAMKKEANIEIETFIHGAVCYCYSGQCLFSSLIGGRSGNRGRCAQPCRLPYQTGTMKEPAHLLSLKDMSTAELIPELIEAGIDSFKIEGRMKSPEYTAGVTAFYRKYIDLSLSGRPYQIKEQDFNALKSMYIRSEIHDGYYHKQNGPEMITLHNPGYAGQDETLLSEIRERYLKKKVTILVQGVVNLTPGKRAALTVFSEYGSTDVEGELVMEAMKQPLTEESVRKQLEKTGGGSLRFDQLTITLTGSCFLPVAALNQLRREGLDRMEDVIRGSHGFAPIPKSEQPTLLQAIPRKRESGNAVSQKHPGYHAYLTTMEQLRALCEWEAVNNTERMQPAIRRIYLSSDLLNTEDSVESIIEHTIREVITTLGKCREEVEVYLALPYILRKKDASFLEKIRATLTKTDLFAGLLVRNLEAIGFIRSKGISLPMVTDAGVYVWNRETVKLLNGLCSEHYLPYELNKGELTELQDSMEETSLCQPQLSLTVYGRIPMMVTANCVAKTTEGCCHKKGSLIMMKDRHQKMLPVYLSCGHCYNIIYNSVRLSLHNHIQQLKQRKLHALRLDFTTEDQRTTAEVLAYFKEIYRLPSEEAGKPPYEDYTNGHWKRGVE